MPTISIHSSRVFLLTVFIGFFQFSFAQKAGLEVTRCNAIDRNLTLKNVVVDATGRRYAANSKGVFQVRANDLATPVMVAAGDRNVLSYPGGNADFSWSDAKFKEQVEVPCSVTAAWFDTKNQVLWLGTDEAGLFKFSTQPEFKKELQYLPVNSKLKSPHITHIFQDSKGRLWIGNEQGIMYGTPGLWKSDLSGFSVQRVREFNNVIYVLADGAISKAPGGEKWSDLALQEKHIEGDITDFDIDATGKMWIVAGNLTRFDMIANTYDVFSGPEYYTSQYGNTIAIDQEGAVWVGTEDKGLFSVDKASNMVLSAFVEKAISCEGDGKDAVLLAKVTGGDAPFTYSWSGGLSGENPKNIGAGTYSVTVTDSKGKTRTAEIGVPDSRLKLKVRQKKPASGPTAADGSAEVDIATNASGITVVWDNGEALVTATKLTAGDHKVTVTDPKGCVMTLSVTITEQGTPLSLTLNADGMVKCAGDKAVLLAKPQGGKPPYKYQWSNAALSGDKPSAIAGNYTLTVIDAAGASVTASINLPQPEPISLRVLVQTPPSSGGADGKALAQAKGGTGVYTMKWDNGETAFNATKLAEGTHSVSVTDGNGCTTSASFSMESKVENPTITMREALPIKCAGGRTNLIVIFDGGKRPYKSTVWDPVGLNLDNGVKAGTYSVTATDAQGATATASITIKEPQLLTASAIAQSATSPGIEDGKALVSIKGGTGTMFFKWDNGETTAATNHLAAGAHTVTVTDENGCTATANVTITEGILPLSMTISETSKIKCAGEKAFLEVQITGGKGPFKYNWSNPALVGGRPGAVAGDYTVTMTDASGATATAAISVKQPEPIMATASVVAPASTGNSDGKALARSTGGSGSSSFKWSNGESNAEAQKLAPGNHSVTVTDSNGCTATANVAISENVIPLSASIVSENKIKCAGDKISVGVEVSGGKKPYQYKWNNPSLTDGKPGSLVAGDYVVTVTDAAGNSTSATVSIKQPEPLSVNVEAKAPASTGNEDGKAIAITTGGTGPYIYQWSSGESTNSASRLGPGKHAVTATDANGCAAAGVVEITENVLTLTVSLSEKKAIKCAGEKAELQLKVAGGKPPFKYDWNNPALSAEALSNLDAGDYALTVTDAKGNTKTAAITVSAPTALNIALLRNIGASSERSNDGKAELSIKGGTPKYTVLWDTKQTGLSAPKLGLGKHSVTVTDGNGCVQTIDFETEKRIIPELTGVLESGQTIRMKLLNFDPDSSALKPDALPMLDELYDFMTENKTVAIEIAGHTNNLPSDAFADQLSTARAKAVADYLFAKGVASNRVVYKGYGKKLPLVPNTSLEGRRTNQRVEIKILRLKD
jgi:outer membrane protein OmpA-like peptidoglycan-associated protein